MELVGQASVERYLRDDVISKYYNELPSEDPLRVLKCQRWLEESPAKRMIFLALYGDVLARPDRKRRLVDVGGGLTALTPRLSRSCDYLLVDPLPDQDGDGDRRLANLAPDLRVERLDWQSSSLDQPADIIAANDLFPNVDQRLALFLEWALPLAREIRMSLTFHNVPRWYPVQRLDAEERLSVLAFDGQRTREALQPYASRITHWQPKLFDAAQPSVYANGRQVVLLTLKGEA
jgi:hypothetical protein